MRFFHLICMVVFSAVYAHSWQNIEARTEEEKEYRENAIAKSIVLRCKLDISFSDAKKMVHFIENYLLSYVESGKWYISSKEVSLPYDVEYDPVTNSVFIHRITKPIAHRKKFLSQGIRYDAIDSQPVFVETSFDEKELMQEEFILKQLPPDKRLPIVLAATSRVEEGKKMQSLIFPLYKRGDLKSMEDKTFSLKEKIVITKDLMEVLYKVHQVGIFHGDIHLGNLLINSSREVAVKGVRFRIVLIDWAGAKKEEPNSWLWRKDVYSAGCTLYCLFFIKKHSNSMYERVRDLERIFQDRVISPAKRGEILKEITSFISERKDFLDRVHEKSSLTAEEKLEWYIHRMMCPYYEKQENAMYWYKQLLQLAKEA